VETSLTAAWKHAPLLGCYPVDCHSVHHNLRARSGDKAINLMLEDFGLEPGHFQLEELSASEDPFLAQLLSGRCQRARTSVRIGVVRSNNLRSNN